MTAPERICRKCDTLNAPKADFCYLCQAPFPPSHAPLGDAGLSANNGMQGQDLSASPGVQALSGGAKKNGAPGQDAALRHRSMLLFVDAERHNIRLSIILFTSIFVIFALLGALLGEVFGQMTYGLAMAAVIYAILGITAYFSGAKIILLLHEAAAADQVKHQQLINVVDEMSIAAGLPHPAIFVMPTRGMNAFAAGRNPKEAVVAVTQGLLDNLNREELQGVIAHEMAHIKNRDTMFNIHIAILVGAIAMMSDAFLRGAARGGKRIRVSGGSGGRAAIVFLILAVLLAVLAPLASRILQMSISRQREYLADATAAEFTRNPLGLASALSKITFGSAYVTRENRGTQHLFIINPLSNFQENSSELMSTHPPTKLRIQRLRAMAGLEES